MPASLNFLPPRAKTNSALRTDASFCKAQATTNIALRAQASFEFMVLASVLIVVAAIAASVASDSAKGIFAETVGSDAKSAAQLVATEISIAAGVGDGYSHSFFLNPRLYGDTNYSIAIVNRSVVVSWDGRSYALLISGHGVNGTIKTGNTTTISNVNGVISFE